MGKYSAALGIGQQAKRPSLTVSGATEWAIGKLPAVVGGHIGQWAYNWAVKKWPNHKRGAEFVGSLGVLLGAFGLELAIGRWMPEYAATAAKLTDGMIGRAAPVMTRTFRKLLGMEADPKAAQGTAGASLDGDRAAIREMAQILRDSPQTTQEFANGMLTAMQRDGITLDTAGREAVVKSMREMAGQLARA